MLHWETNGELKNVQKDGQTYTFNYPCESSSNCYPYIVHLQPGVYTFECYGGVGGSARTEGGKAASTIGTIFLQTQQKFYLFVGAKGKQYSLDPVFGGGGKGSSRYELNDGSGGGSGGGASDIRIYENDLNSRIMVAAGGGGSEYYFKDLKGGDAGALQGSSGVFSSTGIVPGGGGTQISGGSSKNEINYGKFGVGGDSPPQYGSGGGGGYYGGGAGDSAYSKVSSGGGGSSFIAGFPGCTINETYKKFIFFHTKITTGSTQPPKIIITLHSLCNKCLTFNYLHGRKPYLLLVFLCLILLKWNFI